MSVDTNDALFMGSMKLGGALPDHKGGLAYHSTKEAPRLLP